MTAGIGNEGVPCGSDIERVGTQMLLMIGCLDVCRCYSTHLGFVLDLVKLVTKASSVAFDRLLDDLMG